MALRPATARAAAAVARPRSRGPRAARRDRTSARSPAPPLIGSPVGPGDLDPPETTSSHARSWTWCSWRASPGRKLDHDRATLGLGVQDGRAGAAGRPASEMSQLRIAAQLYPHPHGHRHRRPCRGRQVDGRPGGRRALGFTYLDSGAMYRCAALAALRPGADLDDGGGARRACRGARDRARRTGAVSLDGRGRHRGDPRPRGLGGGVASLGASRRFERRWSQRQRALIAAGRLRRRGPRHRHRRQPRRAAQGLPHRERRRTSPATGRRDRRALPTSWLRKRERDARDRGARARRAARRGRRGRDRHHRARRSTRSSLGSRARPREGTSTHDAPPSRRSPSSASPTSASRPSPTDWPAGARPWSTARPG